MMRANFQVRTTYFFHALRARKRRAVREGIYSVAGLVATAARRRLRVRPGSSRPGASPHAHTRGGLREIRFAVNGNTAIVGPIKFPRTQFNRPVPNIHEFGGDAQQQSIRARLFRYPARPYMGPTLESLKKRGRINKQFAVSVARVM